MALPGTADPALAAALEAPTAEAGAVEAAARETVTETHAAETASALPEDIGTGGETTVPAAPSRAAPALTRENLESYLGARWPVWVGGVALALGGIFLVRYSIEAGLLGPAARLTLATLFGLFLIGAGEFVRRNLLPWGVPEIAGRNTNAMVPGALTAAGAVTLFGAIYAAYAVYDFMGATPAFLLGRRWQDWGCWRPCWCPRWFPRKRPTPPRCLPSCR
jgi:uncharacterized membrane protein